MNPLGFHDKALPVAKAVIAASLQNKGLEYDKVLWENNKALTGADLEKYATDLKLDLAKWKKDMASPELGEWIQQQQWTAMSLGATGTPAFFINGESLTGAQPFEKFKEVIDRKMAQADKYLEGGVPLEKIHAAAAGGANGGLFRKHVILGQKATKPEPPKPPEPLAEKAEDIPIGDSPRKGSGDEVVITEFSDFQ